MKLATSNHGFVGNLPEKRIAAKIQTSAKLFEILSAGIYSDPILAPIRELSCNAYDAHISIGQGHKPFTMYLPNAFEPTFAIEDQGSGIPPEKFGEVFYTYGASTKTDSNDQIGALGLGSKSPFAYTKSSYVVRNRYNGIEYVHLCFINEVGEPDGSVLSEEPTTEPNGLRVEFAVRLPDVDAFRIRAQNFLKFWQGPFPIIEGLDIADLDVKIDKVIEGTGWYFEKPHADDAKRRKKAIAVMGNVPYPMDLASIPNPGNNGGLLSTPMVVTFPPATLEFQASREGLKYTNNTCTAITARLAEVAKEIPVVINKMTNDPALTNLEFILKYQAMIKTFKAVLADEGYRQFFPNKIVAFKGSHYNQYAISEGLLKQASTGLQSFELLQVNVRGAKNRKYFENITNIHAKIIDGLAQNLVDDLRKQADNISGTYSLFNDSGAHFNYQYAPRKRGKLQFSDLVLSNQSLFDITTSQTIKVTERLEFIINDVGNAGRDRFKMLDCLDKYLVNFNAKEFTLKEIQDELEQLMFNGDNSLAGAKITLLSSYPDLRAPSSHAPTVVGTFKARSINLEFAKGQNEIHVFEDVTLKAEYSNRLVIVNKELNYTIADLAAKPFVLFVHKRRSPNKFYDTKTQHSESIINKKQTNTLAYHFQCFDGVSTFDPATKSQLVHVFALTDGQQAMLIKKGVKLVNYREHIANQCVALEVKLDAANLGSKFATIHGVDILVEFKNTLDDSRKARSLVDDVIRSKVLSSFLSAYTQLLDIALNQNTIQSLGLMMLYDLVEAGKKTITQGNTKKNQELIKQYPMLAHLSFDHDNIIDVIEYIQMIDNQKTVATPVISSAQIAVPVI